MKNLYQSSKLLSQQEFKRFEKAFKQAWIKDTAYPDAKEEWSKNNKALGQCVLTALIIYDLYGGRLILDKVNFHIWNELPDGTQQDFSRCQFKEERIFTVTKYKTQEDVLYDETGQRTKILPRYQLLKQRFEEALKRLEG